MIIKKNIDPDFCPLKEFNKGNKIGCTVGNFSLISKKEDYRKYRNMLLDILGIRGCFFRKKKKKN